MSACLLRWNARLITLAIACAISSFSFANRPTPPDEHDLVAVHGNVHPFANPTNDLGRVGSTRVLHGVSVYFKRTAEQQADLDQLVARQQDRLSPDYHQWLTPDEFAARFGAAPQQIQATADWLAAQGLTVDDVSRSHDRISFSGTVAQMEAALHTQMHRYRVQGELHIANSSDPELPAALAGSILGVRNLHDFRPRPQGIRNPRPHLTLGNTNYLAPDDFETIYDLKPFYDAGSTGAGRSIAIIGQTDVDFSDVRDFRSAARLPANDPQKVLVPNSSGGTDPFDTSEADLDLEWSGAIAPNARILYVYVGANDHARNAFDALGYAIDQNLAPVVSISYGLCEADVSAADRTALEQKIPEANAQGQTILASSGDFGPAACDGDGPPNIPVVQATHGFAVDFPASLSGVTGIGGTVLADGFTQQSFYWQFVNNAHSGTALLYIPENVWDDSSGNGIEAGGAGISSLYPIPSWQAPLPGLDTAHRYVPDLALAASPNHDAYLICSGGACRSGFLTGQDNVIGGISAGAPAFTGMLTLIEQSLGQNGMGNVNPLLYQLADEPDIYAHSFHDIMAGQDYVPCVSGSKDCSDRDSLVYFANPGYDLATGLGSVDGFNLYGAISAQLDGKSFATMTVSSPGSAALTNATVPVTATVVPLTRERATGSVQFYLNGQTYGPPVAVSGNNATLPVTFPASGEASLGAAYFGDSNVAPASASPVSFAVNDPFSVGVNPNFTLYLKSSGDQGTSALQILANQPFNGTIHLSCTVMATRDATNLLPQCSFAFDTLVVTPSTRWTPTTRSR